MASVPPCAQGSCTEQHSLRSAQPCACSVEVFWVCCFWRSLLNASIVRRTVKALRPHVAAVEAFAGTPGVVVQRHAEYVEIVLTRDELSVTVHAAINVLEWFVDAKHSSGLEVTDWCDYDGYDDTPRHELMTAMASDLNAFLRCVTSRPLRLVAHNQGAMLECQEGARWSQAVPLGRTE